jgi:NADH-quinone oxidoreductase subunit C
MQTQAIVQQLRQRFDQSIRTADAEALDPWVEVAPQALPEICRFLRDEPDLRFNMLHCISGVDYFQPDPKKAGKVDWEPHLEVLYHLSSIVHKHRIMLRVTLPRWKEDVEGNLPEVPTVSGVWKTANWHEREVYDLMGVCFTGHPDLRRILCPEDWAGHPLRKDYQMPDEYHGIRAR